MSVAQRMVDHFKGTNKGDGPLAVALAFPGSCIESNHFFFPKAGLLRLVSDTSNAASCFAGYSSFAQTCVVFQCFRCYSPSHISLPGCNLPSSLHTACWIACLLNNVSAWHCSRPAPAWQVSASLGSLPPGSKRKHSVQDASPSVPCPE